MKTLQTAIRANQSNTLPVGDQLHDAQVGSTEIIARTPVSNTGYDSQPKFQSAIDWLDITFRKVKDESEAAEIISELEALTKDSYDYSLTKAVFNGRSWSGSGHSTRGARMWYDDGNPGDDGMEGDPRQIKFSLSGGVMKAADFPVLADWLVYRAARNELDCTRIDLCIDDRDRVATIADVAGARSQGNFFNASWSAVNSSNHRGQSEGTTVYFGHPSSHKRLRVYDKEVESQGEIKGIRWEAQFRKKVAGQVLYEVLERCDEDVAQLERYVGNCITGLIDFRDRSGDDPNRQRCEPLYWFTTFCRAIAAEPIRITVRKAYPLVQQSIDWIDKQVAQSLAVVKSVLGKDFKGYLDSVLSDGFSSLNNRKRELIKATDPKELFYSSVAA